MTDMKFKEMTEMIEAELIKEMGLAYLNLSRQQRVFLMAEKFSKTLEQMRERQD